MGEPEAGPDVLHGQAALREQQGKHRLTRFRLFLAAEPEFAAVGRTFCFCLLPVQGAELRRITGKFDVLGDPLRIFGGEQGPFTAPAKCLEPLAAQPIGERQVRVAFEKGAHRGRIGIVELEPQAPIGHVGLEQIARETRRNAFEPGCVAGPVGVACRGKIGIGGLRAQRKSGARGGTGGRGTTPGQEAM